MKAPVPKTMLIVEDDASFREALTEAARHHGYEVLGCDTANEALGLAVTLRPTLIFCDVHLVQGDGRKVLMKLRENQAMDDCQFVLMTADWVGAPRSASIALEADGYLAKPFTIEEFIACVNERYAQANL
ncbi:MAG: response regulator [Verrucomicrobiota bacterium]